MLYESPRPQWISILVLTFHPSRNGPALTCTHDLYIRCSITRYSKSLFVSIVRISISTVFLRILINLPYHRKSWKIKKMHNAGFFLSLYIILVYVELCRVPICLVQHILLFWILWARYTRTYNFLMHSKLGLGGLLC